MSRADRLCASNGFDALLISNLTNIRWLTGFSGSNGFVVLTGSDMHLVTDGRYGVQAAHQLAAAGVAAEVHVGLSGAAIVQHLQSLLAEHAKVGFEAAHVSYQQYTDWAKAFATSLQPAVGIVEAERRTKDAGRSRSWPKEPAASPTRPSPRSCSMLGDGLTEAQVRNVLELRMRELGASGPELRHDCRCRSHQRGASAPSPGRHPVAARRHRDHRCRRAGGRLPQRHDTQLRGRGSSVDQRERYEVVLAAQLAGLAAVGPGVPAKVVDAACRDPIAEAGYGDWTPTERGMV